MSLQSQILFYVISAARSLRSLRWATHLCGACLLIETWLIIFKVLWISGKFSLRLGDDHTKIRILSFFKQCWYCTNVDIFAISWGVLFVMALFLAQTGKKYVYQPPNAFSFKRGNWKAAFYFFSFFFSEVDTQICYGIHLGNLSNGTSILQNHRSLWPT